MFSFSFCDCEDMNSDRMHGPQFLTPERFENFLRFGLIYPPCQPET